MSHDLPNAPTAATAPLNAARPERRPDQPRPTRHSPGSGPQSAPEHDLAREIMGDVKALVAHTQKIDAIQDRIMTFARAQVGKPYDYRGIYGFLDRRDIHGRDAWFCSELVSAAFWAADIPILRSLPHKTAPGDLHNSPLLQFFAMRHTAASAATPYFPVAGEGLRVALYSGHSVPSRLIQFRTWSIYSHAALVLPDHSVIEALPGRGVVHHRDISEFHKPRTCVEIYLPIWDAIFAVLDSHNALMGTTRKDTP